MSCNVQFLHKQQNIDSLLCLIRNQNAKWDIFLFLTGIKSRLQMSDIVTLKKQDTKTLSVSV